jgi:GrpB-like predicted nucleotidyltransferase (UPF0157 family)
VDVGQNVHAETADHRRVVDRLHGDRVRCAVAFELDHDQPACAVQTQHVQTIGRGPGRRDPLAEHEPHYCYAPYREDQMHWFCKPSPARRTHHLHLVPTGSRRFTDVLAFRDYLRAHPHAVRQYEQLKRQLTVHHADNRQAYTDGKSAMVATIKPVRM